MPQIVVLGEALIDAFADPGTPLREARTLHPRPGGAPANVAFALAGLGAEVGFIGKVGADDYGEWLIDILCEKGVDTTYFVADPQAPTMLAVVAVPCPTEPQFILYSGASALLRPEELPRDTIETAQVFVYGSVTFSAGSRDAALQAARWAGKAGRHVIFDVNLRPSLWPDLGMARKWIDDGIASASVVKLNESELAFVTGTDDAARGSRIVVNRGVQLCCVSLGEQGAYFDNGTWSGHLPALDVSVVNTAGSGDAFVAGLAAQIVRVDMPLAQMSETKLVHMIRFANACGGLAATQAGAMVELPDLAGVEQLMNA